MRRDKKNGFNTSVPCLIEIVQRALTLFKAHPAFPPPWPKSLPPLELLHLKIDCLEKAYRELEADADKDMKKIVRMNCARRELKSLLSIIVRYVDQTIREMKNPAT